MNRGNITFESVYSGKSINTNIKRGHGCYIPILDRYADHMNDMLEKHSKVMQTRIDLRYPDDGSVSPSPQHVYDFCYNFKRSLERERHAGGHRVDPRIIRVSEQNESEHPHHHLVVLTNANAKDDYYPIAKKAEKYWGLAIGSDAPGLVNYCHKKKNGDRQENGIIVRRGSATYEEDVNKCFYQASYLAKLAGKDNRAKGSWLSSSTRITAL